MNAAPDAELIAAVRCWLAERRALWINQTYLHEGEAAQREYFLKPLDGGAVQLGFDDWLDRYEDATDLYVRHERQRFDSLERALAYTFEQLPLRAGDFGRAMGGRASPRGPSPRPSPASGRGSQAEAGEGAKRKWDREPSGRVGRESFSRLRRPKGVQG